MSIFGDSTPDFSTPDMDTVIEESAEIQEETQEENTEETQEDLNETQEETDSQEEHSEELLAGKYKSVDELVKGYKNLETMIGSKQQTQQQPAPQQEPAVDYNELFIDNFNANPLGTIQHLVNSIVNQQTAPIHEERQNEVMSRNLHAIAQDYKQIGTEEGMTQYKTKIQEIAADLGNPSLVNNPSPRVLKMAAQELWGNSAAQTFKKATEQGRIDAENTRKAKMGLNVAATKKQTDTPKTEADLIVDGMMSASGKRGLFG